LKTVKEGKEDMMDAKLRPTTKVFFQTVE